MGLVTITERGYNVQQVATGSKSLFGEFPELVLREGQACVIHGTSTVLYYRKKSANTMEKEMQVARRNEIPPPRKEQSKEDLQMAEDIALQANPPQRAPNEIPSVPPPREGQSKENLQRAEDIALRAVPPERDPEITIRLQTTPYGHFSAPYTFSLLRAGLHNRDFFYHFARLTAHPGTQILRFILKDALPVARVIDVKKGDQEAFAGVRKMVVGEFESARALLPGLGEWTVLVVDVEWGAGGGGV